MSIKKLQEAMIRVIQEEEKYAESNVNKVSSGTFVQSLVAINAQKKDENVTYERRCDLIFLTIRKK